MIMATVYYSFKEIDKSLQFDENLFSPNVSLHIKKYKNKDAFLQSFQAWKLLDEVVQKVFNKPLLKFDIKFSKRGKPCCDDFYFSISHIDGFVAAAVSKQPCGIDIEHIISRDKMNKIASSIFDGKEDMTKEEFYKHWTSIEAAAKLFDISVFETKNLKKNSFFKEFIIKDDHIVCIAAAQELVCKYIK